MTIDDSVIKALYQRLNVQGLTFALNNGEVLTSGPEKYRLTFHGNLPKSEFLTDPQSALADAYVNGLIDIDGDISGLIEQLYRTKAEFMDGESPTRLLQRIMAHTRANNRKNVAYHYDIGNDFYRLWLDESMTYSCAYFKNERDDLQTAQRNKVEYSLKKLNLTREDRLLDIGCGWGQLILTAAEKYGVRATGITLSREQCRRAKEVIAEKGLDDRGSIELTDYADLQNVSYNKIISIGMIEHVGKSRLKHYFETVYRLLEEGGLFLAHMITCPNEGAGNRWITNNIFPGGYIPGIKEIICDACESGFIVIGMESLRRHYARTLACWAENFERSLGEIRKMKDERFIRMWRLYLNAAEAAFNSGHLDIHQVLLSKGPVDTLPWTREPLYR